VKNILLALLVLFFAGCEKSMDSKPQQSDITVQKAKLEREIKEARLEADKKRELALLQMKKELEELAMKKELNESELKRKLAEIEAKKELEIQKIQKELKMKELQIAQERMRLEMENQKLIAAQELKAKEKLYIMLILAFLIFLIFVGTVLYIYKKRKDKLIAYRDNLEKYFKMKENETKIAIANKIIDTIASGKLTPEQEQRLIKALNSRPMEEDDIKMIENGQETIEATIEEKRDG